MSQVNRTKYALKRVRMYVIGENQIRGQDDGEVPGAGVRSSTRGKGHEEGGSAYAKAGSSLSSPPGYSRASTHQNQSLPTLLICALTSDFTGGCPPPPSRSLCQS